MSEDFRKRGVAAFAREFGLCWGAVIGATLGLALIMAGITAPLDEAEEWWQWLISVPLGLAVIALGCALAAGSGGLLFNRVALGWYGMLIGSVPQEEYGPRVNNGARALADGLYFVVALALGLLWFRAGAVGGELNWSMEGLLLAFSGVVFGLGSLVPRLYFRRGGRGLRQRKLEPSELWLALVVAVTLGVGLSFGVCQGFAEAKERAERAAAQEGEQ